MFGFDLSPEQKQLRELARQVAVEVYAPLAADWDLNRTPLPHDELKRLADLGFLGITTPEEYGGHGGSLLDALIVQEEIAKENRQAAFHVFESNVGPCRVLEFFGTEEQKKEYLPKVATGDLEMAIGISEPDAGSAATDMKTRARIEGDEIVINGNKRWISNGGASSHYLVYCRLNDEPGSKGIGAVIVPADAPGVSFGATEKLMGFRGIPSADIYFDDVRVPIGDLVVEAGGFSKLFGVFAIERLGNATMSLALAQAALDRTRRYVEERHQFGRPLIEFQNVQMTVATMAMQVEASRLLIYRAAVNAGAGLPNSYETSLAKCYANEMAKVVTDLGMQMHGGNGYTEEYGLERLHRDSHGWAIAGGTPAIQRVRIAADMFGRNFNQRPAEAIIK
ncbi:acyl-CoA dehydrogenase family protein [Nocardioides nitrophenolicus]|uniref:acyl-CoA dehydrogenase family protein n=1 Tax=Nocardioides nitrophenolicus TaxID=60489 RepID=UPI001959EB0A|nr:acyl-CoA dehydrogenase family protein [Nocardioides nitrophenolicus]MBM7516468.1 butyryl-CoA dehydrogenase [Nocardioides nitrophenolicus]